MAKVLVSSCLLGLSCKYNGSNNYNKAVTEFCKDKIVILACPEVLGGLPTPRPPSELQQGDGQDILKGEGSVVNKLGNDVTKNFF